MEYTFGKILELNYSKNEGVGHVILSGDENLSVLNITDSFFCRSDRFFCGTSGLKMVENDCNYEISGNGSVVIVADEIIELEEKENMLISQNSLAGFNGKIKKELVKILDMKFWNVSGPGIIAVTLGSRLESSKNLKQNYQIKELEAKDYKPIQDSEAEPSLLSKILDKNDIII